MQRVTINTGRVDVEAFATALARMAKVDRACGYRKHHAGQNRGRDLLARLGAPSWLKGDELAARHIYSATWTMMQLRNLED